MKNPYISPRAANLTPYTAGEQPKCGGFVKLNTNENPYPPSPAVADALQKADLAALRLYPEPTAAPLREIIARQNGVAPEQVFCGNGSDEVLSFAFAALFAGEKPLLFPDVTYSFYPVYARYYALPYETVPLEADFSFSAAPYLKDNGGIVLANPNAPTGLAAGLSTIELLCAHNLNRAAVLVDEAYIAFGGETAAALLTRYPHLLVVRTLSKSHALAGLRVGYALGSPEMITALHKIKDSFNSYVLDGLAQTAAAAALTDTAYYQKTTGSILADRLQLTQALQALRFTVLPSAANFVFAAPPQKNAQELYEYLKANKVLVRWFAGPRTGGYLRITVGTKEQNAVLLSEIKKFI